jgi:hypothetical protein
VFVYVAALSTLAACVEIEPDELIIGSWVIDEAAQREEIAEASPTELEDFDDVFRNTLLPIRETFHRDGRYEIWSTLGGPFDDRWELESKSESRVTIRSSGHSWVARGASIAAGTRRRSPSVLTYTFLDPDHMVTTVAMPIFGEEKTISYFFVRDD